MNGDDSVVRNFVLLYAMAGRLNEKNKKTYLFNLANDIEEKNDLSSAQPDKVKELQDALKHWEDTNTIKPAWPSAADLLIDVGGEIYYFPS